MSKNFDLLHLVRIQIAKHSQQVDICYAAHFFKDLQSIYGKVTHTLSKTVKIYPFGDQEARVVVYNLFTWCSWKDAFPTAHKRPCKSVLQHIHVGMLLFQLFFHHWNVISNAKLILRTSHISIDRALQIKTLQARDFWWMLSWLTYQTCSQLFATDG